VPIKDPKLALNARVALEQAMIDGRWARETADGVVRLSGQEIVVADMMVSGAPRGVIAGHLGVSAKTIDSHMIHIKDKMGVDNAVQLTLMAIRRGWAK
jgi:DNA-binding NarL/FixJ family response regulator